MGTKKTTSTHNHSACSSHEQHGHNKKLKKKLREFYLLNIPFNYLSINDREHTDPRTLRTLPDHSETIIDVL